MQVSSEQLKSSCNVVLFEIKLPPILVHIELLPQVCTSFTNFLVTICHSLLTKNLSTIDEGALVLVPLVLNLKEHSLLYCQCHGYYSYTLICPMRQLQEKGLGW
jgi:hypothetical protein